MQILLLSRGLFLHEILTRVVFKYPFKEWEMLFTLYEILTRVVFKLVET